MQPYLPRAILGNSRLLVTFDSTGRLYRLFWPHIDFPQHLESFWLGVSWHQPTWGRGLARKIRHHFGPPAVLWLHEPPWRRRLRYLPDTNVLVVWHYGPGLIRETAFAPPGRNLLVRHLTFYPTAKTPRAAWVYFAARPGGYPFGDTTYYSSDQQALVSYHRDFYLGLVGLPSPSAYHCGRRGGAYDALDACAVGHLGLRPVANGGAAACLAWAPLPSELTLYLPLASSAGELAEEIAAIKELDYRRLLRETTAHWRAYLRRAPKLHLPAVADRGAAGDRNPRLYRRSLLVLNLLQDRDGALIAAPEVDLAYRRSGGYGYCWSRDAAYMAWSLDRAGYSEAARRYYAFACRVQGEDGLWEQRHYASGHLAPCWGRQLDETGTVLWGLAQHYRLTRDNAFLASVWPAVRRAADGLLALLAPPDRQPPPTMDLWEERRGQHAYTWASLAAGLREAAYLAGEAGEVALADRWDKAGSALAGATLERFWDEEKGRFFRTLREPGRRVDLSLLGLVYPFGLLPANDPRARATALAIMEDLAAGDGFVRYRRDRYSRGRPWPLAGFWLAIFWHLTGDKEKARELFARAAVQANELGLLPEQAYPKSRRPAWVVPLGWAHAMFILAFQTLYGQKA